MNASLASPLPSALPSASTKPLWAAVGILSVCVLAMGATLVHINKAPVALAHASLPFSSAQAMQAPAAQTVPMAGLTEQKITANPATVSAKSVQNAPKLVAKSTPVASDKTVPAPVAATPSATAPVVVAQAPSTPAPATPMPEVASGYPVASTPTPAQASAPTPVVVAQAPAKPACTSCGTVEAVTPVSKEGQGSGVGVIAGGVLGGVVGNQMGKGSGRTATTILGAIGGGWAGNAIEKKMKKETTYSVRVRMEDGTSRTIEQSTAPMVGNKVTLDGTMMRPA